MSSDELTRVHYYERQFLGVEDFRQEQAYHVDMRRRGNVAHHTWGIVIGLEVAQQEKEGGNGEFEYYITPGVAIDGFGREIVLLDSMPLDASLFQKLGTDDHYPVSIAYVEELYQQPKAGYESCDVADQYGRVSETVMLYVGEPPDHDDISIAGEAVPAGSASIPADESIPYQRFPEAGVDDLWLIRLGSARWTGSKLVEATAERLLEGRTYVADVAAQLLAPAGTLVIRDRWTATPLADADAGVEVTVEGSVTIDRELDVLKDAHVGGDLAADGDATVGGSLEVGADASVGGDATIAGDLEVGDDLHTKGDAIIDGKVGVGTSTPDTTVHIAVGTDATYNSGSGYLVIGSVSGENVVLDSNEVMARDNGTSSTLHFQANGGDVEVHANKNDVKQRVIIKDNGYVGIGTETPDVPLHIATGSDATATSNGTGFVVIGDIAGLNLVLDDNEVSARNNSNVDTLFLQSDGGDLYIHRHSDSDKRVIVKDDGTVGIGTSTPSTSAKLDVNGRILRQGQAFTTVGVADHNDVISAPWGGTGDWNIFVSPNSLGDEVPNDEFDNAMLKIECFATATTSTSWTITARCKYKYDNADDTGTGTWVSGKANYLLIPR